MKILVIGGTRFIGPPVVRRLSGKGHELTLLHRGRTKAELPDGVRELTGDRADPAFSFDEARALEPEIVLDMIPLYEGDAEKVMDAFRGTARRVVAISSQDVYRAYGRLIGTEPGPPDPVPLTEDSPLREKLRPYCGDTPRAEDDPRRRLDLYDKIPAEKLFLGDPELPGTVLRLPMVYGPGDYQHRFFDPLKRMADGRPTILIEEKQAASRDTRAFVENVAEAIALAVTRDEAAGRVYNVGDERALSSAELVRELAKVTGWRGEVVVLPAGKMPKHLLDEAFREQDLVTDCSRIHRELGYADAISFEEGLRRMVEWELANPPEFDSARFDYAAEDAALAAR